MRTTWVSVSSWRLCTGYPATRLSSHSVVQAVIFFLWRPLTEREIISQSVLTRLKILVILFFFLRNIRNAESSFSFTGLYFFISFFISFCNTSTYCKLTFSLSCVNYALWGQFPFLQRLLQDIFIRIVLASQS